MNPTNAGESLANPTMMLKSVDLSSIPEINFASEADFRNFVPTGLSVTVNLPIIKNSRSALFGVNIDGFIPPWNSSNNFWNTALKNLFPIQPFENSIEFVKVKQEMSMMPAQALYLSHRVIGGNVGVGVRLTSNTGQSGNILVSQASGVVKRQYNANTQYTGMSFLNTSIAPIDYSYNSFMLADVSLNRNVSITPIRRDPVIQTDLALKISKMIETTHGLSGTLANIYSSQFQEDWLLFGIVSDMANQNANQLNFTFFFDYTNVQFYYPMLPIISTPPDNFERQILETTFTLTANNVITHANTKFLPEDESSAIETVLQSVRAGLTSCVNSPAIVNTIKSTEALSLN